VLSSIPLRSDCDSVLREGKLYNATERRDYAFGLSVKNAGTFVRRIGPWLLPSARKPQEAAFVDCQSARLLASGLERDFEPALWYISVRVDGRNCSLLMSRARITNDSERRAERVRRVEALQRRLVN